MKKKLLAVDFNKKVSLVDDGDNIKTSGIISETNGKLYSTQIISVVPYTIIIFFEH